MNVFNLNNQLVHIISSICLSYYYRNYTKIHQTSASLNIQQQTSQQLIMLPSNPLFSKNLESLLSKYRHKSLVQYSPQQSIFACPVLNQSQQSVIREIQEELFIQKHKVGDQRHVPKPKSMEKERRRSNQWMRQGNIRDKRYNVSADTSIEYPLKSSKKPPKLKKESTQPLAEQKLLRKRNRTQYLLRRHSQHSKGPSIDNRTLEPKSNSTLEPHQNQRKQEPQRKQWVIPRIPAFIKQLSKKDPITLHSRHQNNNSLQQQKPGNIQSQKSYVFKETLYTSHKQTQEQKQNLMPPIITPLHLNEYIKKSQPKMKRTKQVFLNRVVKSNTQSLRYLDDKISPWGRFPESMGEEEFLIA